MLRFLALILLSVAAAAPALAGPIELRFVGTVRSSPTETVMLVDPATSTIRPYAGSNPPSYPVGVGEEVVVTFSGMIPDISTLPPSPDGIYRFPVASPAEPNPVGAAPVYYVDRVTVGTLGSAMGGEGEPPFITGFDLIYDSRTGAVSVDIPNGTFLFDRIELPTFTYDPVADLFTPTSTCKESQCNRNVALGTATSLSFRGLPIFSPDGDAVGHLGDLVLDGSFAVATPIDAPAPFALLALALGALAVARRRTAAARFSFFAPSRLCVRA